MTVKKIIGAAAVLASSFAAQAADVKFDIQAVVPDNTFYVTGTGWEARTQVMTWNEGRNSLSEIKENLKMKNAAGGIKAYLQDAAQLYSAASNTPVDLTVKIQNDELKVGAASGVEIVSAADARTEQTRVMTVTQTAPGRPVAGTYDGTITMMFDNVPTPP